MVRRETPALGCYLLNKRRAREVHAAVIAAACIILPMLRTPAQQSVSAADTLPPWAYTIPAPRAADAPRPAPLDDTTLLHVPGSTAGFTAKYIAALTNAADWFPDTHPPMPDVVAHGHKPAGACAHCHLPNGLGGPENANLAGQSEAYMLQQVEDFRSGARRTSSPNMGSVDNMIKACLPLTPEELRTSVSYFASLKPQKWIRVVASDTAPVTHVGNYILVANTPAATEPIGDRVIEVPVDVTRSEMKDSSASFIAYISPANLERGEDLVKTGGGKTLACAACHGSDLHGMGAIPAIAGRTPSGMSRQLFDIKSGARNGAAAALMKPVVANLTTADIAAITGYLASLNP